MVPAGVVEVDEEHQEEAVEVDEVALTGAVGEAQGEAQEAVAASVAVLVRTALAEVGASAEDAASECQLVIA